MTTTTVTPHLTIVHTPSLVMKHRVQRVTLPPHRHLATPAAAAAAAPAAAAARLV